MRNGARHQCQKCGEGFTGREYREYLFTNDAHALSCPACFTKHVFGNTRRDLTVPLLYFCVFISLFFAWYFIALVVIGSWHFIAPISNIKGGQVNAILVLFPHIVLALFALGMAHWIASFILKLYRWSHQRLYLVGEAPF